MVRTYTIAMATRLRRKVFSSDLKREYFVSILPIALLGENIEVTDTVFRDDGVILCVRGEEMDPDYVASVIRHRTSGRMRDSFEELFKMPSLWTKRVYSHTGKISDVPDGEIEEYYKSIRTR